MTPRVLLLLALLAAPALAQAPAIERPVPHAPPGVPAARFPAAGRPVADIVSPTRATESFRDRGDEFGQVARALGLRPGLVVADIGAGDGYYTLRVAPLLEPDGRVIAQDVTPRYLQALARRVRAAGLSNVTLALGEPHDPRLPPGSVDVAVLGHVYHEVAQPYALLWYLAGALRPGGRLAIIDLDRPVEAHGIPPAQLRCELAAVGFQELGFVPLGAELGYLAVFAAPERRPEPGAVRACQ